jgi:hypothetical protein
VIPSLLSGGGGRFDAAEGAAGEWTERSVPGAARPIVDVGHPLVKLGKAIDWRFQEDRFGAAYSDRAGHPPLPTRLMSDEDLCARWIENPYFQLFCDGMTAPAPAPCWRRIGRRTKGSDMSTIPIIGLDIAKNVFQVHGAAADGAPVPRRQIRRGQVLTFFANLPSCVVELEACFTLISGRGRSSNSGMKCG